MNKNSTYFFEVQHTTHSILFLASEKKKLSVFLKPDY